MDLTDTYFLGANTPAGFRSEYDTLQTDPRIRRLLILKGGPGCGKSTLMKTLGARAEEWGLETERILCSSDPDSLDGLVIPEAELALVDGTAPHVVEPRLCGCGANYMNLGRHYREELLRPLIPAIQGVKAANAACYGPVYASLEAAGALARARRELPDRRGLEPLLEKARAQLLPQSPQRSRSKGGLRRVFLTGVTPKGLLCLDPGPGQIWVIVDRYGVSSPLLEALAAAWREAGEDVTLALDPLEPRAPAGVLVPGRGLAWLRQHPAFPAWEGAAARLDLDTALAETLSPWARERLDALDRLEARLLGQAVDWLAQAKAHHDLLEELYRPAVDFAAVTGEAEALARELLAEV